MESTDEVRKKRFLWAVLLVWTPWIPIAIGLGNTLFSIPRQKATGIGIVAGGLTELIGIPGSGCYTDRA
jgi:hypothetical protein